MNENKNFAKKKKWKKEKKIPVDLLPWRCIDHFEINK